MMRYPVVTLKHKQQAGALEKVKEELSELVRQLIHSEEEEEYIKDHINKVVTLLEYKIEKSERLR